MNTNNIYIIIHMNGIKILSKIVHTQYATRAQALINKVKGV